MERKKNKTREMTSVVSNTIFDDVFRTIVERMPRLVIPLINEVFQTDYSEDEEIIPIHNEHQTKSGEIITDSCLLIRGYMYHIECQSVPDNIMAIRMIEYDFAIALENVKQKNGMFEMEFPRSCTIYLRHTKNTPDELLIKVHLKQGTTKDEKDFFLYRTPVIKVQNYTKTEIFQKKLLVFLPFYIMRYENSFREISENSHKLETFLAEYEEIRCDLEKEYSRERQSVLYADLIDLIIKISDYMLKSEKKLRERIGGIMGGKVLKLRSEELIERGHEQGVIEGIRITKQVLSLQQQGKSEDVIALEVGISREEVKRILDE